MSSAARALGETLADSLRRAGQTSQADTLLMAVRDARDGSPGLGTTGSDALAREVAASYYADALAVARAGRLGVVAEALRPLTEQLHWTQTTTYVRSPPHERFLERYAHATILGSQPSTSVLVDESGTAAVGVLLLGPDNQYPHHEHYADEVYLPLTRARWSRGTDEPYVVVPPGGTLHHRPLQSHSMHTDDGSLLALYLWTGDTTTSAWLS